MTTDDAGEQGSPWLSVWLKPRITIDRVLARYSIVQILLLACLNAALSFLVAMVTEGNLDLPSQDWRALTLMLVAAGLLGAASLYAAGFFFGLSGRLFRGRAAATEVRAALVWGGAPTVIGLLLCCVVLAGLSLGGVLRLRGQSLGVVLQDTSIVFGIWSLVATLMMLSRVQKFGFWRTIASGALGYVILILIAVTIRTLAFEPFSIPSGSMTPTLLVGDYVFVSKYRYGYSRYSIPLALPIFAGRVMGKEPERGDVVVYRQPQNPSIAFVKRLVGLPGDIIQVNEGILQINGQAISRQSLGHYADKELMIRKNRWRDSLPDGRSYEVLDAGNGYADSTEVYTVPAGRYFVLGDNRNNSMDSRMPESQGGGLVPDENLVGRVELIFYSQDVARIGTVVR